MSMEVTVFRESGGIGGHVVEQVLAHGHEVTAYVRDPAKLAVSDAKLTVVNGRLSDGVSVRDALRGADAVISALGRDTKLTVVTGRLSDGVSVRDALRGADAVISALGPDLSRKASGMPLADGTKTIVDAMVAGGVDRYIGMATSSLRDPRDEQSLMGRLVPVMVARCSRAPTGSCLPCRSSSSTALSIGPIARFIRPTGGQAKGTVRAGFLGRSAIGSAITRADIAAFLLAQLTDTRFHRAAPAISN